MYIMGMEKILSRNYAIWKNPKKIKTMIKQITAVPAKDCLWD